MPAGCVLLMRTSLRPLLGAYLIPGDIDLPRVVAPVTPEVDADVASLTRETRQRAAQRPSRRARRVAPSPWPRARRGGR